jgi:hypothetical protein
MASKAASCGSLPICARRNELRAVKVGTRRGTHGVRVTAWGLAQEASC